MFGYVALGGQRFEAFLWEDEQPDWFDCVILSTRKALEQEIVALHFRVPADRVFLDEGVKDNMTVASTAIADKCKSKLSRNEKIGKKVSFDLPALQQALSETMEEEADFPLMEPGTLSEADMEFEVELMLGRMDSGVMTIGQEASPFPSIRGMDLCDGAMLYEAETFGGKFVDEPVQEDVGGGLITQASTLKRHLIETFIDSPQNSIAMPRGATLPAVLDGNMELWSLDVTSLAVTDDESSEFQPTPVIKKRAGTAPNLRSELDDELPPMDDEPALLSRQPAFVSTRGKEREIWDTYREEITATWRAELEDLRRDLFMEAGNIAA